MFHNKSFLIPHFPIFWIADTLISLGISLGTVFVVTLILSGFDLKAALVTIGTICMILVNLGGFMVYGQARVDSHYLNLASFKKNFYLN